MTNYSPKFTKVSTIVSVKKDNDSSYSRKLLLASGTYKGSDLVMSIPVINFNESTFMAAFYKFHECIREGSPDDIWMVEAVVRWEEYKFILFDPKAYFDIDGKVVI